MSLAKYNLNGVGFINTDTATKQNYGNLVTGYSIDGIDIGDTMDLQSFSMVAGSITASGYTTKIIEKYNTGDSWTSANQTARAYQSCAMSASGKYAVAGVNASTGKIYYSSDYGQTWTLATVNATGYFYQLTMSPSGQFACVGIKNGSTSDTYSYYSSDYGQNWTLTSHATSGYKFATAVSESGKYQLVGDYFSNNTGGLYYSSNYGANWTLSNAGSVAWRSVAMSASGQYAVASSTNTTTVIYSMDYGEFWRASASTVASFVKVSMSYSGQYVLGCAPDSPSGSNKIYYSKDYGVTWTKSLSAPEAVWQSCAISGTGQYGLASISTASTGKVYYSTDFGETWTAMTSTTTGSWNAVAISSSGQYAIGCMGTQIYYSSNTLTTTVTKDLANVFEPLYKYKTWTAVGTTTGVAWSGIACTLDGKNVIASYAGASGTIMFSSNYGDSWSSTNPVGNITGVAMANDRVSAYASLYSNANSTNVLYTSSGGGNTWAYGGGSGQWMLSVATSSSGKYILASRDNNTTLSTGSVVYSWNHAAGWGTGTGLTLPCSYIAISGDGNYGLACPNPTYGNGIYFSGDSGYSWTKSTSFTTTTFNGCAMSLTGNYAIAGPSSSGKIQYSRDFGATWVASNSDNQSWKGLSMSESGQYCVAACGNEKIYYSNDYGVNWTSTTATDTTAANATNDIAISKNGQYAFLTTTSGKIYKCVATNN